MKTLKYILMAIGAIGLCYFSWNFERKVNYDYGYQEQVEKTIKEKVKAECLK